MGVCIETVEYTYKNKAEAVTPYMGVCIETSRQCKIYFLTASHTLYGCVY